MDLGGGFDEVLEMRAEQEVAERDKLAVSLILDVDDAPTVLAAADLLAADDDGLLGADDGEGDDVLVGCQRLLDERSGSGKGELLTLIEAFNATSSWSCSSLSYGYMRRL